MSTPTPDLGRVITSDRVRQVLYSVYAVAVVLLGAVQVAYAASEAGQPEWLTVALAVAAYCGAALSGMASVNTKRGKYAA